MRGLGSFILGAVESMFRHNPKVRIDTDKEGMTEYMKKLSAQEIRERNERHRKMKVRKRKKKKKRRKK